MGAKRLVQLATQAHGYLSPTLLHVPQKCLITLAICHTVLKRCVLQGGEALQSTVLLLFTRGILK